MLVVTGIFEFDPEDAGKARDAGCKVAAITRTEDGCYAYAFYEDIETPGRFRVYEEWRDEPALRAHLETEHIAEFRGVLGGLRILSRDVKILEGCQARAL